MHRGCLRTSPTRLSDTPPVRAERTTSLPRASVLRRCSPGNVPVSNQQPSRATAKPLKPGLVSIAGDLHLHIDAINVHLSGSNPPPAGQQDVASMLRSSVPDPPTPAPSPSLAPFSCVGTMTLPRCDFSCYFTLAMCSDGHSFVHTYEHSDIERHPNDEVALWDVRNPAQRVAPLLGDSGAIRSVAVSDDGRRIALACENGLWLWDTWQGRAARLFPTESNSEGDGDWDTADLQSVAITPDGRYAVAGGCGKMVQVWDLQTETCIANVGTVGTVAKVAIAPDGRTATALVTVLDDNNKLGAALCKWSAEHGCAPPVQLQGWEWGSHPAVSADGSMVLTDNWSVERMYRWNSESGKPTPIFQEAGEGCCLDLSADGRRALLWSNSGLVSVWDVQGDTCLATLNHGDDRVTCAAISADGRHAVSYSRDGRTCVWHLG